MNEEQLRKQINDIIEGELQLGINEFLEEKQRKVKGYDQRLEKCCECVRM